MCLTRKKHLEGMRRHHDEEAHEWGPPGADRPSGGADRPAASSMSALLLEPSSTAYEN
jgi:hypothetical protein